MVEAGITRIDYRVPGGRYVGYTEAYAGATLGHLTTRLYLSPDYFRRGNVTGYIEVEGTVSPARNWGLNAHVGALTYLSAAPRYTSRSRIDWRIGASRQLGSVSLHAALSGRAPGGNRYASTRGRLIATAGASIHS